MKLEMGDVVTLGIEIVYVGENNKFHCGRILNKDEQKTTQHVYFDSTDIRHHEKGPPKPPVPGEIWKNKEESDGRWKIAAIVDGVVFSFYKNNPSDDWRPGMCPCTVAHFMGLKTRVL
jgi:hypothetical protein